MDSSWLLSNEKTQFLLGSQQPSVLFMLAIKSYDFHWILDHKMHLSGLHAHRLCTREMLILSWSSYMKPSKLYSKPETRNPYTLKPAKWKPKKTIFLLEKELYVFYTCWRVLIILIFAVCEGVGGSSRDEPAQAERVAMGCPSLPAAHCWPLTALTLVDEFKTATIHGGLVEIKSIISSGKK